MGDQYVEEEDVVDDVILVEDVELLVDVIVEDDVELEVQDDVLVEDVVEELVLVDVVVVATPGDLRHPLVQQVSGRENSSRDIFFCPLSSRLYK